jgi:hypothetical protein
VPLGFARPEMSCRQDCIDAPRFGKQSADPHQTSAVIVASIFDRYLGTWLVPGQLRARAALLAHVSDERYAFTTLSIAPGLVQ